MTKPSILCIDDDEGALRVAAEMLRRLGHDVIASTDAREALQVFKEKAENIKLVIADVVMPGITGTALARGVHDVAPEMPVILTTGYQELISSELTTEAAEAGVRCVVPKPFSKSDLREAIARALQEEVSGRSGSA